MEIESRVLIRSTADIVTARQKGRALALSLGFDGADLALIATAISEVARNILTHAQTGEVILTRANCDGRKGIAVVAADKGPGIRNIDQAMEYGYSTVKGLGVGLPGAKWLMDDFDIVSRVGEGTTVSMKKWLGLPHE